MKKVSLLIVLGFIISAVPVAANAMTLGDVLTQYELYKKEATLSALSASVLGAVTTDGGKTTIATQKPPLPAESGAVLMKGLVYSEKSPAIVSKPLKRGMTNSSEVKKLQLFLISKGYLSADPTGKYGQQTVEALKKFQAEKGIKGDGTLVGPATRSAITSEVVTITAEVQP